MTVRIRPEGTADIATVGRLVAEAFGADPVDVLLEDLRASTAWRPG